MSSEEPKKRRGPDVGSQTYCTIKLAVQLSARTLAEADKRRIAEMAELDRRWTEKFEKATLLGRIRWWWNHRKPPAPDAQAGLEPENLAQPTPDA